MGGKGRGGQEWVLRLSLVASKLGEVTLLVTAHPSFFFFWPSHRALFFDFSSLSSCRPPFPPATCPQLTHSIPWPGSLARPFPILSFHVASSFTA